MKHALLITCFLTSVFVGLQAEASTCQIMAPTLPPDRIELTAETIKEDLWRQADIAGTFVLGFHSNSDSTNNPRVTLFWAAYMGHRQVHQFIKSIASSLPQAQVESYIETDRVRRTFTHLNKLYSFADRMPEGRIQYGRYQIRAPSSKHAPIIVWGQQLLHNHTLPGTDTDFGVEFPQATFFDPNFRRALGKLLSQSLRNNLARTNVDVLLARIDSWFRPN